MLLTPARKPGHLAFTLALTLTACGGGGSGDGDPPVNSAPTAANVSITDDNGGDAVVGDSLTGSYTYNDVNGDAEGASTLRWLRSGSAISGATTTTYTLVSSDSGQSISLEVTPVAATGTASGSAVSSGAITVTNSAPTAGNVSVTDDNAGDVVVGDNLTGSYTYNDMDGDAEGTSILRWLRNGSAISGATTVAYTLVSADEGQSISFAVTPVAAAGTASGSVATSGVIMTNGSFLPAFPGAEGFGARTAGGRGGQVIKVINLNDSGPGSLREAVEAPARNYLNGSYEYESMEAYTARLEASGRRIVVFEVSGIINLESTLMITYPYITVAGQTSPGGILVTGYQTTVNTHDVIIRHMRFRVGSHRIAGGADPEKLDSFDIRGKGWNTNDGYNIIIDHCSFSWGVDETFTITGGVNNTTVQWSIVSEGLSYAGHPKGEHSKGLMVSGKGQGEYPGTTVSLHHNYLTQNAARNPEIYTPEGVDMTVDITNNVVYNWDGGRSPQNGGAAKTNWVHNYVKQGVDSNSYSFEVRYSSPVSPAIPLIYVDGNIGSTRLIQSDPQWNVGVSWTSELLSEDFRQLTSWPAPPVNTTEMSYDYALEILSGVGATVPVRDSVDERVIGYFAAGTGALIDNVIYPDDFPLFEDLPAPADSDGDGMADSWEEAQEFNVGVNDSALDHDGDGYTNIEEYLHYLAEGSPMVAN